MDKSNNKINNCLPSHKMHKRIHFTLEILKLVDVSALRYVHSAMVLIKPSDEAAPRSRV